MGRLPRLKLQGEPACYHCYNRANGLLGTFPLEHPAAYRKLKKIVRHYVLGYFCQLSSFSIMGNHYHLILHFEAFRPLSSQDLQERARHFYPRAAQIAHWSQKSWERFNQRLFDVSELMRNIQAAYTKWHNRRFHRRGPFWDGRFKSTLLADLEAIQECLLYVDLNAVRAGLVQRPEQYQRCSAYLRDLQKDDWLMPLEAVFPDVPAPRVYSHYRALLLHRGALPNSKGAQTISDPILHQEQGFQRQGLYRKRLRYFTEGLVVGTEECIYDWILQLRRRGRYLRRRHPIFQSNGLLTTLREQRSLSPSLPP